jgi:tetratricopeptide (TPR) repeat protein
MDEEAIFLEALHQPGPQARAAFLDRACAGDDGLRHGVEMLLHAHERAGTFLEATAQDRPTLEGDAEQSGTVIDRYKLLEQIGEGGFGVVFMAEQQEPICRKVALKVIKPGMDTRQVVARFEAERQALALMDHPNIARVLDAGQTAGGRPYFIMDLVRGLPVTDYCDQARLDLRERLGLFVDVCRAVQHAHQKGIIHRDLKPSNVLVTQEDGSPLVKVIDFGIAKALGQRLTDKTLFTGIVQMVGTPLYMSPEQAGLSNADVDTRSDVYSLGVLLYELLTGTTPFEQERFKEAGYDEIRRIICEEEPPRPSARISTLAEAATVVAGRRQEDPRRLSLLCRGELDWIVLKALEKDRARRYESSAALAADVQNYLQDQPVAACPPSAWYRGRKFARRYRGRLALAGALLAAVLVSLSAGIVVLNRERTVTAAERDEKQKALEAIVAEQGRTQAALKLEAKRRRQARAALDAMSSHVVEDWLARQKAQQLTASQKQFLGEALAAYEEFARDSGQDEASRAGVAAAYLRVGRLHATLGQTADAETAYRRGAELWRHLAADFPTVPDYRRQLGVSHGNLGALLTATGRPEKALAAHREALAIVKQLADDFPSVPDYRNDLAISYHNLAVQLTRSGHAKEAEAAYRDAGATAEQLVADHPAVPEYRHSLALRHTSLGRLLMDTGRPKQAEAAYRDALAIGRQLAADFPTVPEYREILAVSHCNVGNLLMNTGRPKEALIAYRQALAIQKQLAAEFPTVPDYRNQLAISHNDLGNLLARTGQTKEAEAAYRESLAIAKQLAAGQPAVPEYRELLATNHNALGVLLASMGRLKEAEDAYHDALAVGKLLVADFPTMPEYRSKLAMNQNNLAILLKNTSRPREAEAAYRDALAIRQQLAADLPTVPDYQNDLAGTFVNLGNLLVTRGEYAAARRAYEDAVPHHAAALRANPRNPTYRLFFRNNRLGCGDALVQLGEHRAAAAAATQLIEAAVAPARDDYNAARYLARCVSLAEKDKQLSDPRRKQLIESYSDQAMAALLQAVRNGYTDAARMRQDTNLGPLRGRADFKQLLGELSAKARAAGE